MSLKIQNKEKLREIAEYFGADVAEDATNPEIVDAIESIGGSWAEYKRVQALDPTAPSADDEVQPVVEDPVEPVVEEVKNRILVKMTRPNRTFVRRGYKFTQKHPFVLVEEDTARYFLEEIDGFRLASPDEARNYYN